MTIVDITPVVLSYNEAANLGRVLSRLRRFDQVVVVDSGSTDGTQDIAATFGNVTLYERSFDTHAKQWNFATSKSRSDWVLSLDADYVVDGRFIDEIAERVAVGDVCVYSASFQYVVYGVPLHRAVLPPRHVLFRRSVCDYFDDGHTQRLDVRGKSGVLQTPILHDDRKPLSRWLWAQGRYASLEASKLSQAAGLNWVDRVRRHKWIAPLAVFLFVMGTGGWRDGQRGLYYAQQRMIAEALLSLELIEADLEVSAESGPSPSARNDESGLR